MGIGYWALVIGYFFNTDVFNTDQIHYSTSGLIPNSQYPIINIQFGISNSVQIGLCKIKKDAPLMSTLLSQLQLERRCCIIARGSCPSGPRPQLPPSTNPYHNFLLPASTSTAPTTIRTPPVIGDQYTGVFSSLLISTEPKSATFLRVTMLKPVSVVIIMPNTITIMPKLFIFSFCLSAIASGLSSEWQFINQVHGRPFSGEISPQQPFLCGSNSTSVHNSVHILHNTAVGARYHSMSYWYSFYSVQ